MGVENRYHDEEATEIAERHDKIKEENDRTKTEKELERLRKYWTPYKENKTRSQLQNQFHDLITNKDLELRVDKEAWRMLKEEILDQSGGKELWSSLCNKYGKLGRILQ